MSTHRLSLLAAAILAACGAGTAPESSPPRVAETEHASDDSERATDPGAAATPALASSGLRWELLAVPARLTMADRESFRLRRQVTNEGAATTDATPTATFTVNSAASMTLDMAFGNGVRASLWAALPPGRTASDDRAMGTSLFTAPGDYVITMATDGVTVTTSVHVDP